MGGRTRPITARHGLIIALALLAAGCANTNVQVSGGSPQPAASAPGNSALGALLLLGFIVSSEAHNDGTRYRANPFDAIAPEWAPPPPLDPARRVLEVDCTKPIEDWSANLKCR